MMHMRLLSATPRAASALRSSSNASISLAFPAARWTSASITRPRMPLQQLAVRRGFSTRSSSSSSGSGFNAGNSSDGFFKRVWTQYNVLLMTHPVSTKVVTGATIALIGDVNCQVFLEPDQPFNAKRAAIFTLVGGVFIVPILHRWYGFLGRVVPGTSNMAIAKRLAMDQLGFAPTFLPIFFTALLTLEGNVDKVPEKIRNDWWPAVTANWIVWVPAQLINFRFVPGTLQVLFSNVVGLFWNSYLSYLSHSDAPMSIEAIERSAAAAVRQEEHDVVVTVTVGQEKPNLIK
ncbi:Peroxisomal membrane mpv17 pmp22-like protein [Globisporangium polare]